MGLRLSGAVRFAGAPPPGALRHLLAHGVPVGAGGAGEFHPRQRRGALLPEKARRRPHRALCPAGLPGGRPALPHPLEALPENGPHAGEGAGPAPLGPPAVPAGLKRRRPGGGPAAGRPGQPLQRPDRGGARPPGGLLGRGRPKATMPGSHPAGGPAAPVAGGAGGRQRLSPAPGPRGGAARGALPRAVLVLPAPGAGAAGLGGQIPQRPADGAPGGKRLQGGPPARRGGFF